MQSKPFGLPWLCHISILKHNERFWNIMKDSYQRNMRRFGRFSWYVETHLEWLLFPFNRALGNQTLQPTTNKPSIKLLKLRERGRFLKLRLLRANEYYIACLLFYTPYITSLYAFWISFIRLGTVVTGQFTCEQECSSVWAWRILYPKCLCSSCCNQLAIK